MGEPRHVVIGTPAYANSVSTPYTASLLQSVKHMSQLGWRASWLCHGNVAAVPRIRNRIAHEAIQEGADDLVFIDADIAWEPDALLTLLGYDAPIVGGVMPTTTDEFGKVKYPFRSLTPDHLKLEDDGLVEVQGLPTAFLRIRRDALDALTATAPKATIKDYGEPIAVLFDYSLRPYGRDGALTHAGEDFHFCEFARENGFRIMLDPYLRLTHLKDVLLEGALADGLTRQEAPDA